MSIRCNPTYGACNPPCRQNSKKPQTNDRGCQKSGIHEVGVRLGYDLIEFRHSLLKLGADATGKIVSERGQFAKQQRRPAFHGPIGLGQRR